MAEPLQPTPDDATLPDRVDVTRVAPADAATMPPATPRVSQPTSPQMAQSHAHNYEVAGEVARGGMGAVLRAKDLSIERTVAMKVVLDAAADNAEMLQRFTTEAKLTGQLEHPNIVPVHDLSFDDQGRPFYTMKFVQGVTLHDILAKLKAGDAATVAQYPLAHLLTIYQKICDAVAFAHSKHVIHRDLKPANIMVGDYGEVLVMDWGLAKQIEDRGPKTEDRSPETENQTAPTVPSSVLGLPSSPALTLAGQIMGSPQYMAPEQAAGELDKLDGRTDIFALGGILYNILTLHPPVNGTTIPEMLQQIRDGTILPPTSYNPKTGQTKAGTIKIGKQGFPQPSLIPLKHCPGGRIPESLGAVAMKALALRQEDRYQTVPELQLDIAAYQSGFATRAENASAWRQLALLVKRHKKEFTLAAVALLVLVVTVAGFLLKVTKERNRAEAERQRAEANEKRAETEKTNAQTERDRAEKTLGQLHDTAPTFYDQTQVMVGQGQWSNALEKASIAAALAPEVAEYHVLEGNLLQTALRMAEARDAYSTALKRQPDHQLAQENRQLCETFLRAEDGTHPVRLSSLTPIQQAMLRQGRTTEAGAFTKFIQQAATDQASAQKAWAEAVTAWSNVLVQAGLKGRFEVSKNGLILFKQSDGEYTNDSLAVFQGMPLYRLSIGNCRNIRDLRPLQRMPLVELDISFAEQLHDLRPLRGMPLQRLNLMGTPVADLRPLQGLPIKTLWVDFNTQITDLTPLLGMPLEELKINSPGITNLSPLQSMPLQRLFISNTSVSDLTPLTGMQLTKLVMGSTKVSDLRPLHGMPLKSLSLSDTPVRDLSPLKGMPLEELVMVRVKYADLTPLQGMPLTGLSLSGISDLTPLQGLPLKVLQLRTCPATDLNPLRGMPLTELNLTECNKLQDLTPLLDCRQLNNLAIPVTCTNIECLRTHPTLQRLGYTDSGGALTGVIVPTTVAEFWKAYDAKKTNAPAAKPTP